MTYIILMIIKVPGYDYFIELSKTYELEFHPNITDTICCDDNYCEIKDIHIDLDTNTYWMRVEKNDDFYVVESKKEAVECLISAIEEHQPYDWNLNNYNLEDWHPK